MRAESRRRIPAWLWPAACAIAATLLRVGFQWRQVFGSDVRFLSIDPWYNIRVIEYLVHNFPHSLNIDPYLQFPYGARVPMAPLFTHLVATVAWLAGGGSPSTAFVRQVAALAPPVLGGALVFAIYDVTRRAIDVGAARTAALLAAVMPGVFLTFSLLGFTDHHVLESLLAVVVMSTVLELIEQSSWRAVVTAGFALGLYLLTWNGGALFVLILTVWALVQTAVDVHARRHPVAHRLPPVFVVAFVFAMVPEWRLLRTASELVALVGGVAAVVFATLLARIWIRRRLGVVSFALTLVATGALAFGTAVALRLPGLLEMIKAFNRFGLGAAAMTISEARPLLGSGGAWSIRPIAEQFSLSGFVAPCALVALAVAAVRRRDPKLTLLAVWSAMTFAATLMQLRFAYYSGANVAILVAWAASAAWKTAHGLDAGEGGRVYRSLAVVSLAGLLVYPSARSAVAVAHAAPSVTDGWIDAMQWMRRSTPEPLGNPEAFLARYAEPGQGQPYQYSPGAYGVLSWWDYGYWIIDLAHRIPTATPTQQTSGRPAEFLMATTSEEALRTIDLVGARYVVVSGPELLAPSADGESVFGKFDSVAIWAGRRSNDFYDVFVERRFDGALRSVPVFYPNYYRTLAARLYVFGGAAAPATPSAIRTQRLVVNGTDTQEIVDRRSFPDAAAATAFLESAAGAGYRLVGFDPRVSCVAIDALKEFVRVHDTPQVYVPLGRPEVRVFRVDRSLTVRTATGARDPSGRPPS
jgi:dolichyl-diphosphooligosaccharide--protein glycosyltransferase